MQFLVYFYSHWGVLVDLLSLNLSGDVVLRSLFRSGVVWKARERDSALYGVSSLLCAFLRNVRSQCGGYQVSFIGYGCLVLILNGS